MLGLADVIESRDSFEPKLRILAVSGARREFVSPLCDPRSDMVSLWSPSMSTSAVTWPHHVKKTYAETIRFITHQIGKQLINVVLGGTDMNKAALVLLGAHKEREKLRLE